MCEVVLTGFFLGYRELGADLVAPHLRGHEFPLDVLPQVVDRHPLLLQRGLEPLVVLKVLLLAQVRQPFLELLVAQPVPPLLRQLDDQQLVDRVDQNERRDLGQHFFELFVVLDRFGIDVFVDPLTDGGDLPGLELRLRDDVAIHLHEHLLDDLGSHRHREHDQHQECSRSPEPQECSSVNRDSGRGREESLHQISP
jgi:hypothetical protein